MIRLAVVMLAIGVGVPAASAQTTAPQPQAADFVLRDYRFESGETLPELRLHYLTLGSARRNAAGEIVNGVLLLHGTSGSSETWLQPAITAALFAPGQPLDATRYFLIIPDSIGSGGSSKPSDGLKMTFPHYRYRDVIRAQYRMLTEGLGIRHLQLVAGASMGGMQTWMWGTMYPGFMDALVPVASQPTAMSGRNWIARRVRIDAIKHDPSGAYIYTMPLGGLMTESVVRLQEMAPTREAADAFYERLVANARKVDPANQVYALEASMDYDPSPELHTITARVLAINFADDAINPPELGVMEPAIRRIPHASYVLVPAGPETRGHYTYMYPELWKSHLARFMTTLEGSSK